MWLSPGGPGGRSPSSPSSSCGDRQHPQHQLHPEPSRGSTKGEQGLPEQQADPEVRTWPGQGRCPTPGHHVLKPPGHPQPPWTLLTPFCRLRAGARGEAGQQLGPQRPGTEVSRGPGPVLVVATDKTLPRLSFPMFLSKSFVFFPFDWVFPLLNFTAIRISYDT